MFLQVAERKRVYGSLDVATSPRRPPHTVVALLLARIIEVERRLLPCRETSDWSWSRERRESR